MKTEYCLQCCLEIPPGACQQGGLINGEWHPFHVGCSEVWCNEEIEVWTITAEDYGYTSDKDSVLAEIDHLEDDQELTVRKWKMPRIKYLELPEANL